MSKIFMSANDPFENADPQVARLLAEERPRDNAQAMSVSELSLALKRTVEDRFGHVRVRGEISGFKRAASGHIYFSLKDDNARLDAVMWKGGTARLPFAPEDGLEVVATGKLTTYAGRSNYKIVIDSLEVAGEGAMIHEEDDDAGAGERLGDGVEGGDGVGAVPK
jgi:exodeoxyribonuclease VII large subunit